MGQQGTTNVIMKKLPALSKGKQPSAPFFCHLIKYFPDDFMVSITNFRSFWIKAKIK